MTADDTTLPERPSLDGYEVDVIALDSVMHLSKAVREEGTGLELKKAPSPQEKPLGFRGNGRVAAAPIEIARLAAKLGMCSAEAMNLQKQAER